MGDDRLHARPVGTVDAPPRVGTTWAAGLSGLVVTPEHGDAPVTLSAHPTRASLPTTVTVTLHNRTARPFWINYYDWSLWKRAPDGRWAYVCPDATNDPLHRLPAGERHTWTVEMAADAPAAGERVPIRAAPGTSRSLEWAVGRTRSSVEGRWGRPLRTTLTTNRVDSPGAAVR
jgi:hypothetical protein